MNFKNLSTKELTGNIFTELHNDWMLISSGDEQKLNMMTASWGGFGVLWNKHVSFAFVRPQRYTLEFLEAHDYYSLSFFEPEYREELSLCGRKSGRDIDKIEATGFNPIFSSSAPYFKEASKVMICKKIYTDFIKPENFIDKKIIDFYPEHDYHKVYIGEIVEVLVKR